MGAVIRHVVVFLIGRENVVTILRVCSVGYAGTRFVVGVPNLRKRRVPVLKSY